MLATGIAETSNETPSTIRGSIFTVIFETAKLSVVVSVVAVVDDKEDDAVSALELLVSAAETTVPAPK
ncbi:TPA: hypothetical protein ACGO2R_002215, partial [Streptococcus suis]